MSGKVTLYAATVESVELPIKVNSDPTATVPYFALSATSAVAPGTFFAGTWVSSYDSTTDLTTARTPTLGSAGSMVIASGSDYSLWVKVTLLGEVAQWPVATIHCP